MKKKTNYVVLLLTLILMVGCTEVEDASVTDNETESQEASTVDTQENSQKEEPATTVIDDATEEETSAQSNDELFAGYKLIQVDGCNTSGHREAKVVVDIGYGEREYWAFTNVIFRSVGMNA